MPFPPYDCISLALQCFMLGSASEICASCAYEIGSCWRNFSVKLYFSLSSWLLDHSHTVIYFLWVINLWQESVAGHFEFFAPLPFIFSFFLLHLGLASCQVSCLSIDLTGHFHPEYVIVVDPHSKLTDLSDFCVLVRCQLLVDSLNHMTCPLWICSSQVHF